VKQHSDDVEPLQPPEDVCGITSSILQSQVSMKLSRWLSSKTNWIHVGSKKERAKSSCEITRAQAVSSTPNPEEWLVVGG
jgi:hypothetical protein